jgi:hypothetical protein
MYLLNISCVFAYALFAKIGIFSAQKMASIWEPRGSSSEQNLPQDQLISFLPIEILLLILDSKLRPNLLLTNRSLYCYRDVWLVEHIYRELCINIKLCSGYMWLYMDKNFRKRYDEERARITKFLSKTT